MNQLEWDLLWPLNPILSLLTEAADTKPNRPFILVFNSQHSKLKLPSISFLMFQGIISFKVAWLCMFLSAISLPLLPTLLATAMALHHSRTPLRQGISLYFPSSTEDRLYSKMLFCPASQMYLRLPLYCLFKQCYMVTYMHWRETQNPGIYLLKIVHLFLHV